MKISLIETAGFKAAIIAMRLPHRSNDKSDSWFTLTDSDTSKLFVYDSDDVFNYFIGPKDMELSQKLIRAGDEHAKAVRAIKVWLKITGPWYWFNELDTYRVGTTQLGSTSSMHTECKGLSGSELQAAKGAIRGDYEYTRVYDFTYQSLRRIHKQRKPHRLPEWKQFCDFIETLPLSKELITVE